MATTAVDTSHDVLSKLVALADERLHDPAQSDRAGEFLRRYYQRVAPDDLVARDPRDLYGAALTHWQLGTGRPENQPVVQIYNPDVDENGWDSAHTVVDVVTDDMPFVFDSITMVMARRGLGMHLAVHPVLCVERDDNGTLVSTGDAAGNEAWIHLEIDRISDAEVRAELQLELLSVLRNVRAAVEDWAPMREQATALAEDVAAGPLPTPVAAEEASEAEELLRWLTDDNFTFLGYREYELAMEDGEEVLRAVPGTGLGLLRDEMRASRPQRLSEMSPEVQAKAHGPNLLVVTRANSRSTVHRPDYLSYIGVKQFAADGTVTGERRFLGLYAATAYRSAATDIPFLRHKVQAVLARSGLPKGSHGARELWNILETYPRDELFQISVDELFAIAMGILHLHGRKQVRLFARRDDYGRFVSCLIYLPRDRYSTTIVERMKDILLNAYGGESAEYDSRISSSVLARLHVLVYTGPDAPTTVDDAEVERRLASVTRWWIDDLRDDLIESLGEEQGLAVFGRHQDAFPAAYREAFGPRAAVNDLRRLAAVGDGDGLVTALYNPLESPENELRFKLYTDTDISLSAVVPLLEQMGVQVTDERPFEIRPTGEPATWLFDFGLRLPAGTRLTDATRDEFRTTFTSLWRGETENDGFNRLVLIAGLSGRQITILRAYAKYLRQIGLTFSPSYVEATLANHPAIAVRLVELFTVRFDPDLEGNCALEGAGIAAEIAEALDQVASLDEDRILRAFLHLVQATTRTNYFRHNDDDTPRAYLSMKLDPNRVLDLPLPKPKFEIWVYSPRVEGVHLRGGPIARGGLRWSDRREDFRTEVLGLMKAQMVKNAVIVPTGAKGGFVVKRPPAIPDPEVLRAEVVTCYRAFISGLLDITDNLEAGTVVPPPRVVRHDGDDPYLVVAADKGTATFSDIANEVAIGYGFWLGDAFASGGSAGYDHKAMGITARGAWESVRRHFRVLGIDVDTAEVTVAGIGDMSGDVFGNGMLLSSHLRLLAAFDHRHVFLDPDPDPAVSYAERVRLFALPRSSWDDYDRDVISAGGGVWPRAAKSIPLSEAVQARLGITATALTPNELISAILTAPVDLLWNGGIGTYVKASTESNADVGDRANDAVRVNGGALRSRVVGEGGNLGFTQRGRVEYALAGGMINTDAIDNSAGVDCSDHEVNIKILLDSQVASGDLTVKQRNQLLVDMTDEVADLVLRDNYQQNVALAVARVQAASMVDVHARYLRALEVDGVVDRDLEALPSEKQMAERQTAGLGLVTPEFSVILAYTKMASVADLLASDVPEDDYFVPELAAYFPTPIRQRFADVLPTHRLRREIVATSVVNDMVNFAGTSFDHRMVEETGGSGADITRSHVASRDIFSAQEHRQAIEALDDVVDADTQMELFLGIRRLVERGVLWLLRHRRPPLDIAATVAAFKPGVAVLAERLPDLLGVSFAAEVAETTKQLVDARVPPVLAARAAAWPYLHTAFDVVEVGGARGRSPEDAAAVYWGVFDLLDLGWLWDRIGQLPRADRWQTHARAALRDDLMSELRALTDDVLRAGDVFSSPAELIARWAAVNERAVDRVGAVFGDIRSGAMFDLTTLSVALRQLRNLLLSSNPIL